MANTKILFGIVRFQAQPAIFIRVCVDIDLAVWCQRNVAEHSVTIPVFLSVLHRCPAMYFNNFSSEKKNI